MTGRAIRRQKPAPRERWLTRDEAARLLRAAWRAPRGRHLARPTRRARPHPQSALQPQTRPAMASHASRTRQSVPVTARAATSRPRAIAG